MSKEKKPPLKETNPYKYHRNCFIGYKSAKWLSLLAPFITLFIVNFQDYFIVENAGTQVKLSLGCILALAVGGIAFFKEVKNKPKEEKNGQKNQLSGIVGWGVALVFVILFSSILNDLVLIVGCGFAGQLAGAGFELGAIYERQNMEEHLEYRKQSEKMKKMSKAWGQLTGKHPPIEG